jgi:dTDP-4-amino-4,6-dideoxygalactose transaminase
MRPPRTAIWPSLPLDVYLRKASDLRAFPLDRTDCRLYGRARHALWHGCKAMGLGPGDVVLAPAYHHGSEIEALLRAGLDVRYFDVTSELEPNPSELDRLLGKAVRVLYLIHYLGFPQDAGRWRNWCNDRGLLLFEDAAQAWLATRDGIPVGSHGDLAIFCLYKTLGVPDGAAVTCRPQPHAPTSRQKLRSLDVVKRHGAWLAQQGALAATVLSELSALTRRIGRREPRSANEEFELGDPNEPPSFAAAWLLPRAYDVSVADRRRANYRYLLERLSALVPAPLSYLPDGASPFAFPIETDDPDQVVERLRMRGVNAMLLWKHAHPSLPVADFPTARRLRETVIAIPVHQELTSAHMGRIADAVEDVLR